MIVLDSNIFFAALIKDSTIRKIILEYDGFFLFPEYILDEFNKHKTILIGKSGLSNADFEKIVQSLIQKTMIVTKDRLIPYRDEALELVKNIDPFDEIFVACSLAFDAILWSDDKKLKKISKINVLNTAEIIEII